MAYVLFFFFAGKWHMYLVMSEVPNYLRFHNGVRVSEDSLLLGLVHLKPLLGIVCSFSMI